jgi:hypothetical protein
VGQYLEETDSNRKSNASGSQGTFALRDGPRISLQFTQQVSQHHITLVNRLKKAEDSNKRKSNSIMSIYIHQYYRLEGKS